MIDAIRETAGAPFPLWTKIQGFLSPEENACLLEFALGHQAAFSPTTVQSSDVERENLYHRSSRKLVGGLGDWKPLFTKRFADIFPSVCQEVGVKPEPIAKVELELVAHNHGDHFGRHVDTLRHSTNYSERTARFLSAVYYFFSEPPGFSGGELRIHPFGPPDPQGRYVDVTPQNNMAVFFPAFAAHEVLKVSCLSREFVSSRFAVNCWFHKALE
jgi:Rps23 Pro-64 3,4-dihydroxylase Tpa1-like proline 4-hydroxylase